MKESRYLLLGVSAFPMIFGGVETLAQAPDASAGPRDNVMEIVVTARKREETITEIPESVSAISGFELEQSKIEDIDDISGHVSNLNLSTRADGNPNVTIRGVGSFGNTQGVGFYVDGVQIVTDASARFGDLERLEVLKGPQGTLYGGSNIGGAVKLVTRKPDLADTSGDVGVVFGDQRWREIAGTLNVPVQQDRMAVRLFGYYVEDDGYLNGVNPVRLNGLSNADVVFWPSSDVCNAPFATPTNCSLPNIAERWRKHPQERQEKGARLSFLAKITDSVDLLLTGRYYKFEGGNNNWRVEDPRDLTFNRDRELTFAGRRRMETKAGTLELNWDAGPAVLTYVGSYTHMEREDTTDLDVTSEVGFDLYRPEWTRFQTHELRATSNGDGPLEWLVGLYYSKKRNDWNSFANFYATTSVLTGAPLGPNGSILSPGPLAILDTRLGDFSQPPTLAEEQAVRIYFPFENRYRETRHYAAFLTTSYRLSSNVELGVGVRIDDWSADTQDRNAALYGTNVPYLKQGGTEFMPKASLSYFLDSGSMVYATFAKGYEPGGFNLYDKVGVPLLNAFDKEEANSYEIGAKFPLANGALEITGAAFYIDYKDRQFEVQQQIAIGGVVENIINAGDTEQYGVEFDMRWHATDHLTIMAGGGLLDAKFKAGSEVVNVNSGISEVDGNFPPWISKYSYSVGAQYNQPITDRLSLLARVDWIGKGPYWFNMENTAKNPAYNVINARVQLDLDEHWSAALNVENVFDEEFYTDGSVWPGDAVPGRPAPDFDPVIGTLGQPRKFTVELRARF